MKHDNHKIKQVLENLRNIKPTDDFKISLRNRIYAELGENFVMNRSDLRLHEQGSKASVVNRLFPQPLSFSFVNQKMLTSLLLIVALLSGSAGTTYAAQSALPGDTLYPVKIVSEKAQTAVTLNNVKEAELHGKFAERRLQEIAELNTKKLATSALVKTAVDGYKAEIAESRNIMQAAIRSADTVATAEIVKLISESAHRDRLELAELDNKIKDHDADNYLREAWNEATAHEDLAVLAMLAGSPGRHFDTDSTATSSILAIVPDINTATTSAPDYALQARVANKISEAAHKIGEAENYITLQIAAGSDTAQANGGITLAKNTLSEAVNLAASGNYQEAFVKAKLAQELADNVQDLIKPTGSQNDRNDDNFYVAPYLEHSANEHAAAPIIWEDLDDSHDNDHEDARGELREKKHGDESHDREDD